MTEFYVRPKSIYTNIRDIRYMLDHAGAPEICPYADRECSDDCLAYSAGPNDELICLRIENDNEMVKYLKLIATNTWYR